MCIDLSNYWRLLTFNIGKRNIDGNTRLLNADVTAVYAALEQNNDFL